jgi:hypothetical protein
MRLATEEYVSEHKYKYTLIKEETDALENYLIAQAFKLASKESKKKR